MLAAECHHVCVIGAGILVGGHPPDDGTGTGQDGAGPHGAEQSAP